ncbi:aquaporin [Phreatobacter sp.]|uniref:aquaporin n=1 Tax=Phreatobacter sp. TaxID=1966341 RepID=UPI003F925F0C
MNGSMKKYLAEFVGSAALVIIGCGAITLGGHGGALASAQPLSTLAILPIGLAFGLAVTAMAYGIGPVSGCHINPAVTIGVWTAGRMPTSEVPGYIIAQFAGAIAGAAILYVMLAGKVGGYDVATAGLGQTGWSGYSMVSAAIAEFVATFLFLVVILGATSKAGSTPVAGLAIGLTLAVLHLAFVPVSGNSLNPSRSFGPALFVGGTALAQVWLFLVVPTLAGAVAGMLFKSKTLEN